MKQSSEPSSQILKMYESASTIPETMVPPYDNSPSPDLLPPASFPGRQGHPPTTIQEYSALRMFPHSIWFVFGFIACLASFVLARANVSSRYKLARTFAGTDAIRTESAGNVRRTWQRLAARSGTGNTAVGISAVLRSGPALEFSWNGIHSGGSSRFDDALLAPPLFNQHDDKCRMEPRPGVRRPSTTVSSATTFPSVSRRLRICLDAHSRTGSRRSDTCGLRFPVCFLVRNSVDREYLVKARNAPKKPGSY